MKGWVIPPGSSSEFVASMEMVLDVYKRPYDQRFPVVCMDESPKQLIEDARPSLPLAPGREKRVDYEYIRHGVANVFMASEPLADTRFTQVTKHKTKREWAQFVRMISAKYPDAKRITLVMDNFSTHLAGAFSKRSNRRRPRVYGTGSSLFIRLSTAAG